MGAKSATMEKDKTGTLGTTRPRETNLLVAREKKSAGSRAAAPTPTLRYAYATLCRLLRVGN